MYIFRPRIEILSSRRHYEFTGVNYVKCKAQLNIAQQSCVVLQLYHNLKVSIRLSVCVCVWRGTRFKKCLAQRCLSHLQPHDMRPMGDEVVRSVLVKALSATIGLAPQRSWVFLVASKCRMKDLIPK